MKNIIISSIFIAAFCITGALAQSGVVLAKSGVVTASIKVYGNCEMCKKRIETSLDRKGIKKATWDTKTKELTVVYNPSKISEQQIHEAVAAVGHDTDKAKATDEVYASLPFCCLYRDHDHKPVVDHR